MKSNQRQINDVSMFSNENEMCLALVGKYCKDYQAKYKLSIIKNVCFINTVADCVIDIPDHVSFAYDDESGRHICSESESKLAVQGIASIFFHLKNT